jgi:hypothetical protein
VLSGRAHADHGHHADHHHRHGSRAAGPDPDLAHPHLRRQPIGCPYAPRRGARARAQRRRQSERSDVSVKRGACARDGSHLFLQTWRRRFGSAVRGDGRPLAICLPDTDRDDPSAH